MKDNLQKPTATNGVPWNRIFSISQC